MIVGFWIVCACCVFLMWVALRESRRADRYFEIREELRNVRESIELIGQLAGNLRGVLAQALEEARRPRAAQPRSSATADASAAMVKAAAEEAARLAHELATWRSWAFGRVGSHPSDVDARASMDLHYRRNADALEKKIDETIKWTNYFRELVSAVGMEWTHKGVIPDYEETAHRLLARVREGKRALIDEAEIVRFLDSHEAWKDGHGGDDHESIRDLIKRWQTERLEQSSKIARLIYDVEQLQQKHFLERHNLQQQIDHLEMEAEDLGKKIASLEFARVEWVQEGHHVDQEVARIGADAYEAGIRIMQITGTQPADGTLADAIVTMAHGWQLEREELQRQIDAMTNQAIMQSGRRATIVDASAPAASDDDADRCPGCGALEKPSPEPFTVYTCGSSSYDGRPDTFEPSGACEASRSTKVADAGPATDKGGTDGA